MFRSPTLIPYPNWILFFLDGLFLAKLGYATGEVKGYIKEYQVNDPPLFSAALVTATLSIPTLLGTIQLLCLQQPINQHSSGSSSASLTCASAICQRILLSTLKDNSVSAFRRLCYTVVYSFVIKNFLVIPVQMIIGAHNALSLFCFLSEIRSFASRHAQTLPLPKPPVSMIDQVIFSHDKLSSSIQCAYLESKNPGTLGFAHSQQPTFVDDTIMAEIRIIIYLAAENNMFTVSIFVGNGSLVEEVSI